MPAARPPAPWPACCGVARLKATLLRLRCSWKSWRQLLWRRWKKASSYQVSSNLLPPARRKAQRRSLSTPLLSRCYTGTFDRQSAACRTRASPRCPGADGCALRRGCSEPVVRDGGAISISHRNHDRGAKRAGTKKQSAGVEAVWRSRAHQVRDGVVDFEDVARCNVDRREVALRRLHQELHLRRTAQRTGGRAAVIERWRERQLLKLL